MSLAANAFEYLRGEADEPVYVFSPERPEEGTRVIIDHWIQRWCLPRSRREESLRKITDFDKDSLRLSNEVIELITTEQNKLQGLPDASNA